MQRFKIRQGDWVVVCDGKKALAIVEDLARAKAGHAPGLDRLTWEKIYYQEGTIQFWYRDLQDALDNMKKVTASPADVDLNTGASAYLRIGQIYDGGNGIQVHLRHRSGYETQYNHLSRIPPDIHAGARVHQKQIIGNVGATGLATGPHLDYRIVHNGTYVNPLSEKFIPGEPIPPAVRPDFAHHARELVARLETAAPF